MRVSCALALVALLVPLVAAQMQADGVMAYPAEEERISFTCFTTDDEFRCGWYCAQAFYVQMFEDDTVALMPFGEGNLVDQALCSDCTLFEGSGVVEGGSLTTQGSVASGELRGGYKWSAVYDESTGDILVNFTDWLEPCEIHYLVTTGDVMGVPPSPGRPLTEDATAVVQSTGEWGGWPTVCANPQPGCETWTINVYADVADWRNLDEVRRPLLVCPARVNVWSTVNVEYTGHDGMPSGSDFNAEGANIVATHNVAKRGTDNITRCTEYFDVVAGCLLGLGPACGSSQVTSMERVREQVHAVQGRRAEKQRQKTSVGRRPAARPEGVSVAAWEAMMRGGGRRAVTQPRTAAEGWASVSTLGAVALLLGGAALWRWLRHSAPAHKAGSESDPLLPADVAEL